MKIKVTKEHIAKGLPNKVDCCPVHLAFRDALPDVDPESFRIDCYYTAERTEGYIEFDNGEYANLPSEVSEKIAHFDNVVEMQPFEFEIDLENRCSNI